MIPYFYSFEFALYEAVVEETKAGNYVRANCINVALYRLEDEENQ